VAVKNNERENKTNFRMRISRTPFLLKSLGDQIMEDERWSNINTYGRYENSIQKVSPETWRKYNHLTNLVADRRIIFNVSSAKTA
jgi:hypothetical protein